MLRSKEQFKFFRLQKKKEYVGDEVWDVRGHHLLHLSEIVRSYNNIHRGVVTARDVPRPARHARKIARSMTRQRLAAENEGRTKDVAYFDDLLGPRKEGIEEHVLFERRVRQYDKNFLALPSDAPIRITASVKDTFCKTCPVIGNHCEENTGKYGGNGVVTDEDAQTYLLKRMKEMEIADYQRKRELRQTDNGVVYIDIITLSAGTLKEVLLDTPIDYWISGTTVN